jgi:uncharacterized protein (TIGR00299 family) protein
MGAAGDMLVAALLELIDNQSVFIDKINSLGIPKVHMEMETINRSGIKGTHVTVSIDGEQEESQDEIKHKHEHEHKHGHEHAHEYECNNKDVHAHKKDHHHNHTHESKDEHHHGHSSLADVTEIINGLSVSQKVKSDALAVYNLIAEAEGTVHNRPVDKIHFHEVGELDAITDIVAVCLLMEYLSPKEIIVSPIHVGSGFVRCAHGLLPVPAPATAFLLRDIPIYSDRIKGELCTPTGAALLKHFATAFKPLPPMRTEKIGYGMGTKEFDAVNCIRSYWGTLERDCVSQNGSITELSCNIDDMTGEAIGYATEMILKEGALDVCTIPVQMKKNRPGILLICLCEAENADAIAVSIFKHTTTLGIRKKTCEKYMMERSFYTVETPYGDVRIKMASGYGIEKSKAEYDDVIKAANGAGASFAEVMDIVNLGKKGEKK